LFAGQISVFEKASIGAGFIGKSSCNQLGEPMKRLLVLTFLSFCVSFSQTRAAGLPTRDEVLRMVYSEQFDQLEKLTDELRAQKVEFYHGYSQLSIVYGYLSGFSDRTDDGQWEEFISKLQSWADAYPQSPAPLVALGDCYVTWAWKARGSGYANTVTDEGWRLMKERLRKAREYLEAAEKLPVKDPAVYNALLRVALGQGWDKDEMDAVFQKGIQLEPNYQQLYESKAYFLLPRWYGRPGEWETFAQEAADARGGDEGDILYMSIARSEAWSESEDFFKNTSISYDRMQRGFEVSLKRYPNYTWEMNSYCYFACIADDRETAEKLFGKINGQWEKTIWWNENNFKQWERWGLNNGPRPKPAASSSQVPFRLTNWKSVLSFFAIVWTGVLAISSGIIWLVVRKPKKT
jgi:Domain of unknown function (DUF4034)